MKERLMNIGVVSEDEADKIVQFFNECYGGTNEQMEDAIIDALNNVGYPNIVPLSELSEVFDNMMGTQYDISSLKKQIKHCKNPLQKKQLETQLNDAYKYYKSRT